MASLNTAPRTTAQGLDKGKLDFAKSLRNWGIFEKCEIIWKLRNYVENTKHLSI